MDRRGPTLRAVIALNPDALAQARALDAERTAGHLRGPLHGVQRAQARTAPRYLPTADVGSGLEGTH